MAFTARLGVPPATTPCFKDLLLTVPTFVFGRAAPWLDTGSATLLAEGFNLKDGSKVLAKIASAHSSGSICLEREAHLLSQLAALPEAANVTLKLLETLTLPPGAGDCIVLILLHPGYNSLARYFPRSKMNDLLLAGTSPPPLSDDEIMLMSADARGAAALGRPPRSLESSEAWEDPQIDISSFVEFGIQATRCLEVMHKAGLIHREVRANAFHMSRSTGVVRLVHFGNRSQSLEQLGGPSALVLKSATDAMDEHARIRLKEALCYLAPEQTGSVENISESASTDLYSLGIVFWMFLVGHGAMPFQGGPMELLHSIVQTRPININEVRRDIPLVVALIIDKLLSKSAEGRYNSAVGLKADLLECQKRLNLSVSTLDLSLELIPLFEIGSQDKYMDFTLPTALFGREKELETIEGVIASHSTHLATIRESYNTSGAGGEPSDSFHASNTTSTTGKMTNIASIRQDEMRQDMLRPRAVVVCGPAVITIKQTGEDMVWAERRPLAYDESQWGHAKFDHDSSPFASILACLSSVLRQLMAFHSDLCQFTTLLQTRLGPQLINLPLLYRGAPELRDVLDLFGVNLAAPNESSLSTEELRVRFQSLVGSVLCVIAEVRTLSLFLDDLHFADASSLDLLTALAKSRCRALILASFRPENTTIVKRIQAIFPSAVWISLEPLSAHALSALVSKTLHRPEHECTVLSRLVHKVSQGNAFSARNIIITLQRSKYISFNWERNHWNFDLPAIEKNLLAYDLLDLSDSNFLVSHLNELQEEARKYLLWASMFGTIFRVPQVALVMDLEDSDDMDGIARHAGRHDHDGVVVPRMTSSASMRGLHLALAEGWLVQRARDMCAFAHDRYRQAVFAWRETLPRDVLETMSLRIVLMILQEEEPDQNIADSDRIAEHCKRCLRLLLRHPKRESALRALMEAAVGASSRGAHELAFQWYMCAKELLGPDGWSQNYTTAFAVGMKIAELLAWKGAVDESDALLVAIVPHTTSPEDQARVLRSTSRNNFIRKDLKAALENIVHALRILGIEINPDITMDETDAMFEEIKREIVAIGTEEIINMKKTVDPKVEIAVALLNDAGIAAYWAGAQALATIIGLTVSSLCCKNPADSLYLEVVQLIFRFGHASGSALGFFWLLPATAEYRGLFRFGVDLGCLGLRIADLHGSPTERCRALVYYAAMVAPYDNVHLRANLSRCDNALKLARASGDRIYAGLANVYQLSTRLFVCDDRTSHCATLCQRQIHYSSVNAVIRVAEDMQSDMSVWSQYSDASFLVSGIAACARALAGQCEIASAAVALDTRHWNERDYVQSVNRSAGNARLTLSWFNCFKIAALYCLGWYDAAADLGFEIYASRTFHPNHRHSRYGSFFHSLALVQTIRLGRVDLAHRTNCLLQIELNQAFIRRWLSPSQINTAAWLALVEAEVASLRDSHDAFRLYDQAVRLAISNDWLLEEGVALYLQGCHFVRHGVTGLGGELQSRAIARQAQWRAGGIVRHLSSMLTATVHHPFKRGIWTADVSIQTETCDAPALINADSSAAPRQHLPVNGNADQASVSYLGAEDLRSILIHSQVISSDVNLSTTLQRLTEVAAECCKAQYTSIIMRTDEGDYSVATSMVPPQPCVVYEIQSSVRSISDPLRRVVIQHALNVQEPIFIPDIAQESRFATEALHSSARSVLCAPMTSNRGTTFGVLYMSSKAPFVPHHLKLIVLLLNQASISISNGLLFRSLQQATRANLRMISAQKAALEEARQSREHALQATKIKSNFLASMSHELRTPFSSFYGLLDILGETTLNTSQREIVRTAKQSCELLLKIIDSILDYSKLESNALKLEITPFAVEDVVADCMELLHPLAATELSLAYNIDPGVPSWVNADYARIRQVLMNLLGNALKFTSKGSVNVYLSVVEESPRVTPPSKEDRDRAVLKCVIEDTGIGMTEAQMKGLFVPFHQADASSTRKFGGTGLGLSISMQLCKLMSGDIGVASQPGVGSTFWFQIPVELADSEASVKAKQELALLRVQLLQPVPPTVLLCSPSDVTLTLLSNILRGFFVVKTYSLEDAESRIRRTSLAETFDFVILDHSPDRRLDDLVRAVQATTTKVIHLFTPTMAPRPVRWGDATRRQGEAVAEMPVGNVVRLTKPPRSGRLLVILASLKGLVPDMPLVPTSNASVPVEDPQRSVRWALENKSILIAEDNPIAQRLLRAQLERYSLSVTATSNGNEAVVAWEAHEPGYFSVALFDHHMPICDGVEATKRIRAMEAKRKVSVQLPIVALSADCQDSTKQLCLSAGMNSFLTKPLKKNDITSLLSMFWTLVQPQQTG